MKVMTEDGHNFISELEGQGIEAWIDREYDPTLIEVDENFGSKQLFINTVLAGGAVVNQTKTVKLGDDRVVVLITVIFERTQFVFSSEVDVTSLRSDNKLEWTTRKFINSVKLHCVYYGQQLLTPRSLRIKDKHLVHSNTEMHRPTDAQKMDEGGELLFMYTEEDDKLNDWKKIINFN